MTFLKQLGAYKYDTVSDCKAATGKPPVPTGRVDVNKGDVATPLVRCRWVIQETRHKTNMDTSDPSQTFSATPPYEALRFLISMTMTPIDKSEDDFVLILMDITRAHPHVKMRRDLWVALPEEDPRFGEVDLCALLLCNVYGTRDAGQNFELFTFEVMDILGFIAGVW